MKTEPRKRQTKKDKLNSASHRPMQTAQCSCLTGPTKPTPNQVLVIHDVLLSKSVKITTPCPDAVRWIRKEIKKDKVEPEK
jgi:hypothetical protein